MTKIFNEKDPSGINLKTSFPEGMQDIFADGIGPMIAGFPMTKLVFFQQRMSEKHASEQEREVVAVIALPTTAILACADQIRAALSANQGQVETAFDINRNLILGTGKA